MLINQLFIELRVWTCVTSLLLTCLAYVTHFKKQLAKCLPKSLEGSSYQIYIGLANAVIQRLVLIVLKTELGRSFPRHKPMKWRSLFTLTKAKKSVGAFYDEVVTAGKSAYADMHR